MNGSDFCGGKPLTAGTEDLWDGYLGEGGDPESQLTVNGMTASITRERLVE
jgi:hypothetical protein